jgi:hypothetical protein
MFHAAKGVVKVRVVNLNLKKHRSPSLFRRVETSLSGGWFLFFDREL